MTRTSTRLAESIHRIAESTFLIYTKNPKLAPLNSGVTLHPYGDPYLLNEGNAGWFGEEPENDHPIPLNDHHAKNISDVDNSEPEVENLPQAAPVPIPNPRPAFHGPTPPWVECLETWSQGQDQPMPFDGDRSFYDLSNGGSADRVLPILDRRVDRNEI